jgi:hypothetical protein
MKPSAKYASVYGSMDKKLTVSFEKETKLPRVVTRGEKPIESGYQELPSMSALQQYSDDFVFLSQDSFGLVLDSSGYLEIAKERETDL